MAYSPEIPLDRAHELINATPPVAYDQEQETGEVTVGPELYDTGLDAAEGLWLRAGWAGRG